MFDSSNKRQLHRNCITTFVWVFLLSSDSKTEIFIFKSITLQIKITLKEEIFPMENYFHKEYVKLP